MSLRALKPLFTLAVIAILLLVIILAAIFQPRGPVVVATSTILEHIDIQLAQLKVEVTMGVHVYVKNRSNSGFEFKNSTTEVYYHGDLVGQAPIGSGIIPGGATKEISASVDVLGNKVISNHYFLKEVGSGSLYFTSKSSVDGKGVVVGAIKLRAHIFVSCDVIVFVLKSTLTSDCDSVVKL